MSNIFPFNISGSSNFAAEFCLAIFAAACNAIAGGIVFFGVTVGVLEAIKVVNG